MGYAVTGAGLIGAGLIGAGLIGASEIGALLTGESVVGESVLSTGDNVVGAELLLITLVSSSSIKFNGSDVGYVIAMRMKCLEQNLYDIYTTFILVSIYKLTARLSSIMFNILSFDALTCRKVSARPDTN